MAAIKISSPATRQFWEIEVLYEDTALLVLNKPADLHTSPDQDHPDQPSLMALVHQCIQEGKPWAAERKLTCLSNAHRLDYEASGVIVLAKSKPVLAALANTFGAEKPILNCVTIVRGSPMDEQFEVKADLASHPARPGLVHVDAKRGKRSRTLFQVLERFKGWTLLRCSPLTFRKHQVRVHLRQIRLPIAGDAEYGGTPLFLSRIKPHYRLKPQATENPLLDRPRIHVESMELPHPVTGAPLRMSAPWPKDLAVAIKYLRKYAVV